MQTHSPASRHGTADTKDARSSRTPGALFRWMENKLMHRVSLDEYRKQVHDVYSGPRGALLATASTLSLHLLLGERLIKQRIFDLAGAKKILDVGSGAGQMIQHLLKYCDGGATVTGFDFSHKMLERARQRLRDERPRLVTADMTRLPFADDSFDCLTCGYVLEHLPDARQGLSELSRVLSPGGRMLLLVTEDTFAGALTSRLWCCRTYSRKELQRCCEELGLTWKRELWFTDMHRRFKAGGICVEIERA